MIVSSVGRVISGRVRQEKRHLCYASETFGWTNLASDASSVNVSSAAKTEVSPASEKNFISALALILRAININVCGGRKRRHRHLLAVI